MKILACLALFVVVMPIAYAEVKANNENCRATVAETRQEMKSVRIEVLSPDARQLLNTLNSAGLLSLAGDEGVHVYTRLKALTVLQVLKETNVEILKAQICEIPKEGRVLFILLATRGVVAMPLLADGETSPQSE